MAYILTIMYFCRFLNGLMRSGQLADALFVLYDAFVAYRMVKPDGLLGQR